MSDRIVLAVCKHIVTQQPQPGCNVAVRIHEPPPDGVVVPALEIIEPRLGVIVVTAVSEWVVLSVGVGTVRVVNSFGYLPLDVVCVGNGFRSVFSVYGYDIINKHSTASRLFPCRIFRSEDLSA